LTENDVELSSISEKFRIEKAKCKERLNTFCTLKGEGRSLKRIVFGIMLMLLAVCSSTIIVKVNSATVPSIVLSPQDTTVAPNGTFTINMTINDANNMRAWWVQLVYQKIINLTSVDTINGTTFTDGPGLVIAKQEDLNSTYYVSELARAALSELNSTEGTGSGLVAQLHFVAVSIGNTAITSDHASMMNSTSQFEDIFPTVTTPVVTVAVPTPPPPTQTVGGNSFSLAITKAASQAPYWIGLASAIVAIMATAIYFRGIKRRKEKQ
jgi:hypothetical protein